MKVFNYNFLKKSIGGYIEKKYPKVFNLLKKHKTGLKYACSGGIGAAINLLILYILTDKIGIWYLTSSVVAFIISLLVGFFLQKFWTFRDNGFTHLKKQLTIYIILGGINFFLSPTLLYVFVERFHIWYVLAAVFVMGTLAIVNYLINKFITFKKDIPHESINV